jgi:hypothetical protein
MAAFVLNPKPFLVAVNACMTIVIAFCKIVMWLGIVIVWAGSFMLACVIATSYIRLPLMGSVTHLQWDTFIIGNSKMLLLVTGVLFLAGILLKILLFILNLDPE